MNPDVATTPPLERAAIGCLTSVYRCSTLNLSSSYSLSFLSFPCRNRQSLHVCWERATAQRHAGSLGRQPEQPRRHHRQEAEVPGLATASQSSCGERDTQKSPGKSSVRVCAFPARQSRSRILPLVLSGRLCEILSCFN